MRKAMQIYAKLGPNASAAGNSGYSMNDNTLIHFTITAINETKFFIYEKKTYVEAGTTYTVSTVFCLLAVTVLAPVKFLLRA